MIGLLFGALLKVALAGYHAQRAGWLLARVA